jgi:hypothetical protein
VRERYLLVLDNMSSRGRPGMVVMTIHLEMSRFFTGVGRRRGR